MTAAAAAPAGAGAIGFYRRRLALEHDAVQVLRGEGYEVFRTDGRRPGVSLIAMAGAEAFLFVCVRRRSRPVGSVRTVAAEYAEDLAEVRRYLSPIVGGELWIWSPGPGKLPGGWRRFAVFVGGIQEIGRGV